MPLVIDVRGRWGEVGSAPAVGTQGLPVRTPGGTAGVTGGVDRQT